MEWLRDVAERSQDPDRIRGVAGAFAAGGDVLRRRAIKLLGTLAVDERVPEGNADRLVVARALMALLPDSLEVLSRVLRAPSRRRIAELQFSVFVFCGEVRELHGRDDATRALLLLVSDYLHTVSSDAAQAPWMAGDALGEHWPLSESLSVLTNCARYARFRAGREGALHGLSHAIARGTKRQQWEIVSTLRIVSEADRSAVVRRYADQVMTDLRGL